MVTETQITEEQFRAFEEVRVGGDTNMWSYKDVNLLSGGIITKDVHIEIIKNYRSLAEKYPGVVE